MLFNNFTEYTHKKPLTNLSQMCSKHIENELNAVCGTCNALVCLVCALTVHR